MFLTGNSADGRGKHQEHLSRFSMPDLSKDSGINLLEKSNKDAVKSSVQFQSSESIHSLNASKPYMEIDPSSSTQYQMQYREPVGVGKTRLPPGFLFQEEDRLSLVSNVNAARLPPISERHISGVGVGGGRTANVHLGTPEDTPQRRRHHHHHFRRSRRSRSENALNLVADRRPRPQERPLLRVCEDYDRFPPPRSSRDRFGVGGVGRYEAQPFRQCPRTTSDLTLQNPGAGRRPGLNQYSWDEYDDDGWCSTCSSSSESEDEGYFLGEPIPKPVQLRYLSNQELVHKYTGMGGSSRSGHLHARKRRKSKNCIIS